MDITNEQQIDGPTARALRHRSGLGQKPFWNAVGVHQPGGCRYEKGIGRIPKAVRILVFIRYVAGLDIDATSNEGAAAIVQIGEMVKAGEHIREAKRLLSNID